LILFYFGKMNLFKAYIYISLVAIASMKK
jgi:hypothetical protein